MRLQEELGAILDHSVAHSMSLAASAVFHIDARLQWLVQWVEEEAIALAGAAQSHEQLQEVRAAGGSL